MTPISLFWAVLGALVAAQLIEEAYYALLHAAERKKQDTFFEYLLEELKDLEELDEEAPKPRKKAPAKKATTKKLPAKKK
jgi:hypothetical protein